MKVRSEEESLEVQSEKILNTLLLEDGVKERIKAKDVADGILVPQIRRENKDECLHK